MRRDDILAVLKDHGGDLDRFGVKSLRLFGSAALLYPRAGAKLDFPWWRPVLVP